MACMHLARFPGSGIRCIIADPKGDQAAKNSSKADTAVTSVSEEDAKWDFFSLEAYLRPWQVPWGWKETGLGFLGWVSSFLLISLITIPGIVKLTGGSLQDLTAEQKSGYILLNQVLETIFGIAIVRNAVRRYEPLPEDVFRYSLSKPFRKPDGWLLWGILGIASSPFLVAATLRLFTSAGYTSFHTDASSSWNVQNEGASTVDEVVKIISPDPATFGGLFVVTAILAPVLEEFVFRGFLLVSFTKFMPVPYALLASSLAFGSAHLSVKDLPELTSLGLLLGLSYLRTRNLLTPVFIHGLWNGTVLLALYAAALDPSLLTPALLPTWLLEAAQPGSGTGLL